MSDVIIALALLGVLIIGLLVGLIWRGTVLLGDRQVVDRLSQQLAAEARMRAATQATLFAMRQAARQGTERGGDRF